MSAFNSIKKQVFSIYINVLDKIPLPRGRVMLARILRGVIGRAKYDISGVVLELDPTSSMEKRMIAGHRHDDDVYHVIREKLKEGDVFVDIGANIGYFSILAASQCSCHVIAFEPSPRELKRFYNNILLNKLRGYISVMTYGLSNENSLASFNVSNDANPGMNSLIDLSAYVKRRGRIDVYLFRFDDIFPQQLLDRNIVCKIDVEGFELSVLEGMGCSVKQMKNATFVVEISPQYLAKINRHPKEIYDFFGLHGFQARYGLNEHKFQYDEVFELHR